jgi:hypothetical protein
VWKKRDKEAIVHVESIAQEVKEVAELYSRTAYIWTILEEDENIQQLEQREEKLNVVVQYLKKRQKTINISLRMKASQELKNLQEEVKMVQEKK